MIKLNQEYGKETPESGWKSITGAFPVLQGDLQGWSRLEQGTAGHSFHIRNDDRSYLLKILPPAAQAGNLGFSLAMQHHLSRSGFPCPEPMVTADGDWTAEIHGRLYLLTTWVQGAHREVENRRPPNKGVARKLGNLLGNLHRELKTADLPEAPDDRHLKARSSMAHAQTTARYFFQGSFLKPSFHTRLRFKVRKSELDRKMVKVIPMLQKVTEHLVSWVDDQKPALGSVFPTHGDINWENILFDGNDDPYLLDFDNAKLQPRLLEVGAAAAILVPDEDEARQAFLAGYAEAGWDVPESRILRRLALLKYARSLNWQIPRYYSNTDAGPERARWLLDLAEGLEKNWQLVLEEGSEGS